ncbi:hypothetical protein SPRG_16807 [Saprolegnia parasitica CBS 223.65]|uniref:Uncharacterized protein n=1 Tax=Saprolegnia parasitica (strain CBS 223.65) TaxID=695850 RepID=A0A067BT29_SAPPC|nr:hypothetical protein SPRG_16807 [Saprolegnia parasitica CBS 223.65]KDO17787.1 hypothetical protein SPRG_16807 [Saprolegnia parasitica CBS 223.65]|eukprot:XP_012211503.1 hypothetical protein SPRG_16807 [Saprolegnia parasitica CBS 223.65]
MHANDSDLHGETALMLAARMGQTDVVRCLLKANAKVNLKNNRGETALWLAALSGHVDVVKQLLERYADIHIVNNVQARGSPEFRAAFAVHLARKDTDEAFTKQAFRKAIACSPALGRMFLNDCVTLDRRDMRFSQVHDSLFRLD